MSYFKAKCPWCGAEYMTGMVGRTLMGSHDCPRKNDPCPCGADSLATGEHLLDCPNHVFNLHGGKSSP